MEETYVKVFDAIRVIDRKAYIYDEAVRSEITLGDSVRIAFEIDEDHPMAKYVWCFDAPYLQIEEEVMDSNNQSVFLGVILDYKREETNKYPLTISEKVWFTRQQVIEIPLSLQKKSRVSIFEKFLTKKRVTVTGPLYTIKNDTEYSDSESDDESVDLTV